MLELCSKIALFKDDRSIHQSSGSLACGTIMPSRKEAPVPASCVQRNINSFVVD